jgi:murein L,D-transpeptidase YcbB/YkuD
MRTILTWAAVLAVGALAWGTEPVSGPAKQAAKKPAATAPKKTVSTASARKAAPVTAARKGAKKAAPAPRTTWRNRQASPTTDRYREIQQALIARGFLAPEAASGAWDQASVDALKRFQTAQNLESNGKINSLSLIALGLGPKYDSPARVLDVNPGQSDR